MTVQEIKDKYKKGMKIRFTMIDPQAPPANSLGTVEFVDDIGQIHIKESGLAIVPEIDDFHIVYFCNHCGKEFSYPPATSRIDGSELCRVCSADEALTDAGIADKTAILQEIANAEE